MFTKKFSLADAYKFGARIVANHFVFFLTAIGLGIIACAVYMAILGVIDFHLFKNYMSPLIKMFHYVANSASGSLHYVGTTAQEVVRPYLPSEIAQQAMGRDIISIDISTYELKDILVWLVPTALALKLFIDMLMVGWTKFALDLQEDKTISLRYLFQYYYLVPRVFVANLIVGIATVLGLMFFIIPGIFIYERLRFARYFIIDKNLSIVKSVQASWSLTEGTVWQLFGFSIISIILDSLGHAIMLFNLFIMPLQNQVEANVYKQLLSSR